MLRVNNLRRFVAMPVMAKRALSADVLSKYGIVPAAATKVFRNLSYDDIYAQGEWRTQLHPIDCPGVLNCSNRHHVCCRGRGGRDCGELRNCDRRHRCDTAIPLLTLTSSFMLFNTIMSFIYLFAGKFTGRSPEDKYIVESKPSSDEIWWGRVNRPMKPEIFDKLNEKVVKHYNQAKKIYVFDGYSGANPISRKKVRFVTEYAWQHHFVTNMFLRPKDAKEIENFEPDFTIINGCNVTNEDWKEDGLNSEVFVTFNLEQSKALIGGTFYGGEMKKGIFSMMHYWLPLQGIMSMHCSANIGEKGDTALYFGLSGTGKTTLSADPKRQLIGDDEHGW